jgi:hypothetical protein
MHTGLLLAKAHYTEKKKVVKYKQKIVVVLRIVVVLSTFTQSAVATNKAMQQ